jgi:hypothetical protein
LRTSCAAKTAEAARYASAAKERTASRHPGRAFTTAKLLGAKQAKYPIDCALSNIVITKLRFFKDDRFRNKLQRGNQALNESYIVLLK